MTTINCNNYKIFTNKIGTRIGCDQCDITNRDTINPCPVDDTQIECFRKNGYFSLINGNTSIDFCKDHRYQDNDSMFMGCDNYFPYTNDINISNKLASKLKFKSVINGRWNNSNDGGYIKYDILDDNIAHISFNTRQGNDNIAKCGIMRTLSIDENFTKNKLTPNHINVNLQNQLVDGNQPLHNALGNKVIKVTKDNFNLQFDAINCSYGQVHIYDYDHANYNYYVYGLGPVSEPDKNFSLDWLQRDGKIRCNSAFGNYQAFGIHASHWPIFYIQRFHKTTGEGSVFAVYFDHYRKLEYDFSLLASNGIINISSREPEFRFFVITGKNILDVKKLYMKIIGSPSIPVRKLLGLWVGGFGFRSFDTKEEANSTTPLSVNQTIEKIQSNEFPLEGFYFDLYWYGHDFPIDFNVSKKEYKNNICNLNFMGECAPEPDYANGKSVNVQKVDKDQLGIFEWDTKNFPSEKIDKMYDDYKYGVTLIYEPYYNLNSLDMSKLYKYNLLATTPNTRYVTPDAVWENWLGSAIIPDFTNKFSGKYWYDSRMKSRMTKGTFLWWNDLGEPEVYNENAMYMGVGPVIDEELIHLDCYKQHPSIHNYVQFLWTRGASKNYIKDTGKRYNVLTRAGCPGISRYGAYSWTGDTNTQVDHMVEHFKNMGTLIISGQDFVCSDSGGFSMGPEPSDLEEAKAIFSYWFANCCAAEITVKPHKWFSNGVTTSSPTEWGDVYYNKENINLRYSLLPYYYSIAYSISQNGHRKGDNFSIPMFMKYPEKNLFDEINSGLNYLIGDNLLIPLFMCDKDTSGNVIINSRNISLPKDTIWFDINNNTWVTGQITLGSTPLLTPYIKNNCIIPMTNDRTIFNKINSEDIYNIPIDIFIFSKDKDYSNVDNFILYIDDGISDDPNNTTNINLKMENGKLIIEYLNNTRNNLKIGKVLLKSETSSSNSYIPYEITYSEEIKKQKLLKTITVTLLFVILIVLMILLFLF
jgi:alpha-glucosidase (family GH31 glycosyl hydrolase)